MRLVDYSTGATVDEHGDPTTGLSALTLARGARALSGAARSAVVGDVIAPVVDVRAIVGNILDDRAPDGSGPFWGSSGGTSAPMSARHNPEWEPFYLDDSLLDSAAQVGPSDPVLSGALLERERIGAPTRYSAATGLTLTQAVVNPQADAAGTAWTVTGGTYSRVSVPSLPSLGLPGTNAHRVTFTGIGPSAGAALLSPLVTNRYRNVPGRTFTVVAWVLASHDLMVDALPEWPSTSYGAAAKLPRLVRAGVVTRLVIPVRTTGSASTGIAPAQVRLKVTAYRPAGSSAGTFTLSVRGAHFYAGTVDVGDAAGLEVRMSSGSHGPTYPGGFTRTVLPNRADLHGLPGEPHATSAYLMHSSAGQPGGLAHVVGTSTGPRLTVRSGLPCTGATFSIYVEEVSASTGYTLTSIEGLVELDLTSRAVEVSVDRSLDADPADASVPIGNYAATAAQFVLDNADGALSPLRDERLTRPLRLEAAVGVQYRNAHPDPDAEAAAAGEGITSHPYSPTGSVAGTPGWLSTDVRPTPTDPAGTVPAPYAVRGGYASTAPVGIVADPTALPVQVALAMVAMWVLAPQGATMRVYTPTTGVVSLPAVPASPYWQLVTSGMEFADVAPAAFYFTSAAADTYVYVAAPSVVYSQLDGSEVLLTETTPVGTFYTSGDWPVSTGGDAVTVAAVDKLAAAGAGDLVELVQAGVTVGDALRAALRYYLDLGPDEVSIAASTPVLPYVLPAETTGQQLADLAKAGALSLFTDHTGRVVADVREVTEPTVTARYREDNALIEAAVPAVADLVRNDVTVVTHPVAALAGQAVATFGESEALAAGATWEVSGSELLIPAGESVTFEVPYDGDAALGVAFASAELYPAYLANRPTTHGSLTDDPPTYVYPGPAGSGWGTDRTNFYDLTVQPFATFARVTITALLGPGSPTTGPVDLYLRRLVLTGTLLTAGEVRRRFTRDESIATYGRRPVDVDLRLGATATNLPERVAADILDNYSLVDPTGERWLPDLEVTTLGDPWGELGDRVLAREPGIGLGGEYRVVSHRFTLGTSGMSSGLYLRRVATGVDYFVLDASLLDDDRALSY